MLFLVALDILGSRRKQQKREVGASDDGKSELDYVALSSLATILLVGPLAIMSVIVVTTGFAVGSIPAC